MKWSLAIVLFSLLSLSVAAQNNLEASSKTEIEVRNSVVNVDSKTSSVERLSAESRRQNKIIAITGVRFAYPLIQKWIDSYNRIHPEVQIIIESRGTHDPATYDILVEAYEPDLEKKAARDYIYVGRYAIFPVANNRSDFSKVYSAKGLNRELIKQLFFHDIFINKNERSAIQAPFTVYTRLQKAGAPIIFSKFFGYQQKDIQGKAIAGSDEHLLKAVLRDSIGLSYLPLNLLFDLQTGKPVEGVTILPVDINGNNKVGDDEKFYADLSSVIQRLEEKNQEEISNVPIEYLNLSVAKNSSSPEAIEFLRWIVQNGHQDLHSFGFLKPEQTRLEREKQHQSLLKGK